MTPSRLEWVSRVQQGRNGRGSRQNSDMSEFPGTRELLPVPQVGPIRSRTVPARKHAGVDNLLNPLSQFGFSGLGVGALDR
jgi:hypothetical protein